ncbi:hypothetical protein OC846_001477 [Tilletia horrida]|uniref:Eukaryotic translation initiation factor 3 subunit M n=1 Tax=Tilletia horrida TaxID=155126 RepID=A0AAN6JTQ5_9BASI|nr:hypothetical protein OC845_006322 [Tilletia horrida]KAK0555925.1 hypothetical protein OC846_001477 [Tilletia horrida]KAK0560100.1 hypothetical protein OC861_006407 [Tilletia horrida]
MASEAAAGTATTGAAVPVGIVSDSITVLVDGSFTDHIVELAPFFARSVQPATPEGRQAFVDDVRAKVEAASGAENALDADAAKRIEILKHVVSQLKALPEPATDRELEGGFNLLLALILTSPALTTSSSSRTADGELSQQQTEVLTTLTQLVASSSSSTTSAAADKSIAKYRILTNFFNALPARSSARLDIFLSLLSLAASSDDLDMLSSSSSYAHHAAASSSTLPIDNAATVEGSSASSVLLNSLPIWLASWNLDDAKKADVLKQVSKLLLKRTNDDDAADEDPDSESAARTLAFHKLFLRFLDATPSAAAAGGDDAAVTTLALALRLPNVFDFASLLESRSIQELKNSQPALWSLLVEVVLSPGGRGKRWDAWKASNAGVLEKIGVPEAVLVRKIRLLDIASLCASQVYSDAALASAASLSVSDTNAGADAAVAKQASPAEVPYSLIASSALASEPESDVETWVIDVIRAGLVSGKLSQVNEVFRVYRVSSLVPLSSETQEVFGKRHWEVLERKLVAWRDSVSRMLDTLGNAARQQQAAVAAAANAGAEQAVQQAQTVN